MKYSLPEQERSRYQKHGLASIPLSTIGWEGAVIQLSDAEKTKVRHVWIRHGKVNISSGSNKAPPSALEISADQSLSELRVAPHRFHISDYNEYEHFLRSLRPGYKIFERQFQGMDGIRIALEPNYS